MDTNKKVIAQRSYIFAILLVLLIFPESSTFAQGAVNSGTQASNATSSEASADGKHAWPPHVILKTGTASMTAQRTDTLNFHQT